MFTQNLKKLNNSKILCVTTKTTCPYHVRLIYYSMQLLKEAHQYPLFWAYGVVVSMFDFHRSDRG